MRPETSNCGGILIFFNYTFINFLWPACRPSKLPIAIEVGFFTSDGDIKEIKRLRAIL